jgi:hypothetical protein
VIGVGSSAPYVSVAAACSSANFTVPKYNAISAGMTLDQVNQTIGCTYDPKYTSAVSDYVIHIWIYGTAAITVYFDSTDSVVRGLNGGNTFKSRSGF